VLTDHIRDRLTRKDVAWDDLTDDIRHAGLRSDKIECQLQLEAGLNEQDVPVDQ
jgi:hypothetical protein